MRTGLLVMLAVLLAAVAGCASSPGHAPALNRTAPVAYALPDRTLTPGAASENIAQVCPHVDPALEKARPSTAVKARVYVAYHIPVAQRKLYVIDHLINLSIDGQNVTSNLWPQPVAQAKVKDGIETTLHTYVCAHPGKLAAAQHAEAANWATAEQVLGIRS